MEKYLQVSYGKIDTTELKTYSDFKLKATLILYNLKQLFFELFNLS